jgi:hypothetical protein
MCWIGAAVDASRWTVTVRRAMRISSTTKNAIEGKVGSAPTVEPLWVRPKTAAIMLDTGLTKIYALVAAGELESCLDGSARNLGRPRHGCAPPGE